MEKELWDRIWARAVADSGIPFKPTAYQVRHTHASWLIDAGENPKAVMHRLGQADLRTAARQSMCSTKPASQPPGGSKGCCRRCDIWSSRYEEIPTHMYLRPGRCCDSYGAWSGGLQDPARSVSVCAAVIWG
jgi:hypothetical protein